jgi:hypothetical protein
MRTKRISRTLPAPAIKRLSVFHERTSISIPLIIRTNIQRLLALRYANVYLAPDRSGQHGPGSMYFPVESAIENKESVSDPVSDPFDSQIERATGDVLCSDGGNRICGPSNSGNNKQTSSVAGEQRLIS